MRGLVLLVMLVVGSLGVNAKQTKRAQARQILANIEYLLVEVDCDYQTYIGLLDEVARLRKLLKIRAKRGAYVTNDISIAVDRSEYE